MEEVINLYCNVCGTACQKLVECMACDKNVCKKCADIGIPDETSECTGCDLDLDLTNQ